MRLIILIFFLLELILFQSCGSREDKAKAIVDEFLTEINDKTKPLNDDLMTEGFAKFFENKSYYVSQEWELSVEPQNDSIIQVDSKGHTFNGLGRPVENVQSFVLLHQNGNWKIFNSFKLISEHLDFQIVDTQWDFFWDRDKEFILQELQNSLKLEILQRGHCSYFSCESRKGKLRLVNNSDFDIKGIKILIEHFDNQGNSVNTDHAYVYDIIRKHGYREFDWYTTDCSKCASQQFRINFIKED